LFNSPASVFMLPHFGERIMLKIGEYLEHRRTGLRLIIRAVEKGSVLCEPEEPLPAGKRLARERPSATRPAVAVKARYQGKA
jgi:hypothetical protein